MKKTLNWTDYENTARQAIAEGCVLLENNNQVLPLKKGTKVSIFGRIQSSYYKSGTGSGGKVNVAKVYSIVDGLKESNWVEINQNLQNIYAEWEKDHPYDEGLGWGKERWSQDEMPLTDEIVATAAKESEVAIAIIGRTAGEDKDNTNTKGSYLLTDEELDMLLKVRKGFKKLVVLLNVGNIIDMGFVQQVKPDSLMYVWQGGMLGGLGTADALTGKINPSGKLTDTIAKSLEDYPSTKNFGTPEQNIYAEDIFVGYRYFETFAKDKVLYPFGYGLSYSSFSITNSKAENHKEKMQLTAEVSVKNTGAVSGKEVVQLYIKAPQGTLGKAEKVLVGFEKTAELTANAEETLKFTVKYEDFASYDDTGITGHKNAFILEEGTYELFAGTDIRSAKSIFKFDLPETLFPQLPAQEALAPRIEFQRFKYTKQGLEMEKAPMESAARVTRNQYIKDNKIQLPKAPSQIHKLVDVLENKITLPEFVAQFSDEDLSCIVRGEGMGSSLVTAGTASAYGGVSPRLRDTFGIPACCCDDGPSGMRLDCGIKAFSLPNGTSLACTFNKELVSKLYAFTGLEMYANKVDNLLGPGLNIHRHPLNGRNFEYFSEDPYLTGHIGTAIIKGLKSSGTTGTIKHFCGNNQEANRYAHNSVISQRALREIYLKAFEIPVRSGYADSVMTTYGLVNGVYTAGSYDLNTTILRNNWGFKGIVMTDWWAAINDSEDPSVPSSHNNFAAMVRAQNDLYMCCPDGSKNSTQDNTLSSLEAGTLTREELQLCAMNICGQVLTTPAMARLAGKADEIEIINKPVCEDDVNLEDVEFTVIGESTTIDLTYQECKANTNYILAWDVQSPGTYRVSLSGSSDLSEIAQLPCTLFNTGIPIASFTFNGTKGKEVTISKEIKCPNRFSVCRLFVASNGLKLSKLSLEYLNDDTSYSW